MFIGLIGLCHCSELSSWRTKEYKGGMVMVMVMVMVSSVSQIQSTHYTLSSIMPHLVVLGKV